jgi:hypothetical protein
VIIELLAPGLIWSPGSEWLTGNFERSKEQPMVLASAQKRTMPISRASKMVVREIPLLSVLSSIINPSSPCDVALTWGVLSNTPG